MARSWRSWGVAVAASCALPGSLLASRDAAGAQGDPLGLKPGLWQFEITYQSLNGQQVLDGRDLVARVLASVDPTDLALDRANLALAHSACESAGPAKQAAVAFEQSDPNSLATQAPCDLPDAVRARAQSSERENGANTGATASFLICLTSQFVRLQTPILDEDDRCRPTTVSQDGKHVHFEFSCRSASNTMSGQGEAHRSLFGHILTQMDFDLHTGSGKRLAVHDNTEMKFISADCGHVKPPAP